MGRRIFFALLWLSLGLWAETINFYHTTITIHPSGALHIEEQIDYDFGDHARHGIFRDIPLRVKIDPYAPEVPVGLEHFSVLSDGKPVPFHRSTIHSDTGGEIVRFRIGDPSRTLTGSHTYTLRYDVARGVYPSSMAGMEAIRWNAVGAGSLVSTRHAVADLILPPVLSRDHVRIRAYTGTYGSQESRAVFHWIDPHHVRFDVRDLVPHEALTVEANYPRGLLGQRADALKGSFFDRLLAGRWHWGALAAFLLWLWQYAKGFGAENRAGPVAPQYYPPEGLSLLQSGLILDKFADKKDLGAAILELGNLGFVEIHKATSGSEPIILRTPKPVDERLTEDQRFLLEEILGKYGRSYIVKSGDPRRAEEINAQLDRVNTLLYDWSVASGRMRANPRRTRTRFLKTAGAAGLVLTILALIGTYRLNGIEPIIITIMATLFIGIGISILIRSLRRKAYSSVFFAVLWLGISGLSFSELLLGSGRLLLHSPIVVLPLLVGAIAFFYRRISIFTRKGLEDYRYLLGYREFMKRVEQDRIRRFLQKDPHYLDRGLPYAVLFGLNRHWLNFYKTLGVAQPGWYYGDVDSLNDFSQDIASQSTPPASESGGFSGGGGFAGGGGGGGGVGSW